MQQAQPTDRFILFSRRQWSKKELKMRSSPPIVWLLVLLVVTVLILQVIHLVIFSCLEMKKTGKLKTFEKISQRRKKGHRLSYFRMDTRGSYQIYHSVSDETDNNRLPKDSVTMVTHCSPHNMHYLPALVERWKGPVSLAVFTSSEDFQATLSVIHSFSSCFTDIRNHVQFHLVLPMDTVDRIRSLNLTRRINIPCKNLNSHIKTHIKTKNYALQGVPYPNNLLRNVGQLAARTNFVFTVDIDLLPSSLLFSQTLQFLKYESLTQSYKMTAYVLPVFELEDGKPVPKDKPEIVDAISDGTVRQFYTEICYRCHSPTDYESWIKTKSSVDSLHVAYAVEYMPLFEPFFIVHKSAPLYDERFKQYGYNRISNTCELYMAGFTFVVMDSGFLVHQGYKRKETFHTSKDEENAANRELFSQIVDELHVKYPESVGSCRNQM